MWQCAARCGIHMKNSAKVGQQVNKIGACFQGLKMSSVITGGGSVAAWSAGLKGPIKALICKPIQYICLWVDSLYIGACTSFSFDSSSSPHPQFLGATLHAEVHHTTKMGKPLHAMPPKTLPLASRAHLHILSPFPALLVLTLLCSILCSFPVSWTCPSNLGLNWLDKELCCSRSSA